MRVVVLTYTDALYPMHVASAMGGRGVSRRPMRDWRRLPAQVVAARGAVL